MLSIIIVNYNVKYFLEQCLHSVRRSMQNIDAEVIILDNQSTDGSIEYLAKRFPEVRFISNEQNLGFAKACNKGLNYVSGEYILFLNPDTLLAEDTLEKCIAFFEQNPAAGALGVQMIDGSGKFLKESKRAFPSPMTSLYKLFGLAKLFPHSPVFSRYYLGNLSRFKNHEVDVLAGAFMMIRKQVLDKTGAFDEAFFMYGEDIDLSYRIQNCGYKNYYLADTAIIHFKGESTKHASLNYVRMFYTAMSIFVKKHYGGSRAGLFNALLHFAIWIRAIIAAAAKFIRWIGLPVIDALLILLSFWLIKDLWSGWIKPDTVYPNRLLWIAFPAYTLLYLITGYYAGLYNKMYSRFELVRSMLIATLVLLAGYALLPEKYRFSRGIILFGSLLSFVLINIFRWALVTAGVLQKGKSKISKPHLLIASTAIGFKQLKSFLKGSKADMQVIGRVALDEEKSDAVAHLENMKDVARPLGAEELIFCLGDLTYKQVLQFIAAKPLPLRLRFHALGSCSIVGSDTDNAAGETVTSEASFNLSLPGNRRLKRLIDLMAACLMLVFFPVVLLLVNRPFICLKNCVEVLAGRKTWIGYSTEDFSLPPLRASVLGVNGKKKEVVKIIEAENVHSIDYWYAKNYEPLHDVLLIVKNLKHLGV